MNDYDKYTYRGPVVMNNNLVAEEWKGTTYAVNEKKARCNLAYQFKKQCGLLASAGPVIFPGTLEIYMKGSY